MTQTSGVFVKQVVFLTVSHRGPLPLRELHSTDETMVWRDPGLEPVYDYRDLEPVYDLLTTTTEFPLLVACDMNM